MMLVKKICKKDVKLLSGCWLGTTKSDTSISPQGL